MSVIDEKILFISVIGILYAIAWMLKPQTVMRFVITSMLGIVAVLWLLDFFEIYPFGEIAKEFFKGLVKKFEA
jgi:hypothetical protein